MTEMDQPAPPSLTPATATEGVCLNCGYSLAGAMQSKCPECGYTVPAVALAWDEQPIGWGTRLCLIGWPFVLTTIATLLALVAGTYGIVLMSCAAMIVNTFLVLFGVARTPPRYEHAETPAQRERRRRSTALLSIWLALILAGMQVAAWVLLLVRSRF